MFIYSYFKKCMNDDLDKYATRAPQNYMLFFILVP